MGYERNTVTNSMLRDHGFDGLLTTGRGRW